MYHDYWSYCTYACTNTCNQYNLIKKDLVFLSYGKGQSKFGDKQVFHVICTWMVVSDHNPYEHQFETT